MSRFYRRVPRLVQVVAALAVLACLGAANAWAGGTGAFGENDLSIAATRSTGDAGVVGVDPSSGSPTAVIPFELNQARGLVQPELALHYAADVDGEGGRGWSLMLPAIERKPLWGLPNYANDPGSESAFTQTDRMSFGGESLIPLCLVGFGSPRCAATPGEAFPAWATGWWYFRLPVDASFQRFFWSPSKDTWRIENADGSVSEYGVPLSEPSYQEATDREGTNVFRWNLVRQWDAHGEWVNPVSYRWSHPGTLGRGYLTDIFDTPPEVVDHASDFATWAHHEHLTYARTPYDVHSGGNPRHGEREFHLVRVDVTSANADATGSREVVRSYVLDYVTYFHHEYLMHVTPYSRPEGAGHASTCREGPDGTVPSCLARALPGVSLGYTRFVLGTPPSAASYFTNVGGIATTAPQEFTEGEYESLTPLHAPNDGHFLFAVPALDRVVVDDQGSPVGCGTYGHNDYDRCKGHVFSFTGAQAESMTRKTTKLDLSAVPGPIGVDPVDVVNAGSVNVLGDWGGTGGTEDVFPFAIPNSSVSSLRLAFEKIEDSADGAAFRAKHWSSSRTFGPWLQNALIFGDINGDGLLDQYGDNVAQMSTRGRDGVAYPFEATQAPGGLNPNWGGPPWQLADLDGDGLADIAQIYGAPVDGTWETASVYYGPGDGRGHYPAPNSFRTTGSARFLRPNPCTSNEDCRFYLHDVNGDGLVDLIRYGKVLGQDAIQVAFNVDGISFQDVNVGDIIFSALNLPSNPAPVKKVMFLDPAGYGLDGIVLVGPRQLETHIGASPNQVRAGMLETFDTGRGLRAQVNYRHLTDLERTGRSTGGVPIPIDVVESIEVASFGESHYRRFTYDDPVYDGWRRKLRGFRHVREEQSWGAETSRRYVDTRFFIDVSGEKNSPTRDDDALEQLPPLPVIREVFAHGEGSGDMYAPLPESTIYRSTQTTTYRMVSDYAVGLDGRRVRFVFPETTDTYLYDNAPFIHQESSQGVVQVYGVPRYDWNVDGTVINVDHYSVDGSVTIRSNVVSHLRRTVHRDPQANYAIDDVIDEGRVGVDQPIHTHLVNALVSGSDALWRPVSATTTGFATPASEVADADRYFEYDYFPSGEIRRVRSLLKGTLAVERFHANPAKPFQSSVPGASSDGTVTLAEYTYDEFGNLVRAELAGGGCNDTRYDDQYHQFPISTKDYTQAGCTGDVMLSLQHFRREFGLSDLTIEPSGATWTTEFDDLGRVKRLYAADPDVLGSTQLALTMVYDDAAKQYNVLTRTHAIGPGGESYTFTDGLGRVHAVVTGADPAAGDAGSWVVSSRWEKESSGGIRSYEPWFATFNPATEFPSTPPALQKYRVADREVFGRVSRVRAQDGTVVATNKYHALGTEVLDEAGVPSGVEADGHGRAIRKWHREGVDVVSIEASYDVGGEVRMVRQTHSANPSERVVRWIQYDSLGRMVANVEPNSVVNFSLDPGAANARRWIYVHDDAGRVVGTSDPRGCGENLSYDALGRLLTEDYSPCNDAQATYSPPNAGAGYEAEFHYDSDPDAPGSLAVGKLVSVDDRGARTRVVYDGRGRTVRTDRRITKPGAANSPTASRYAPHVFSKTIGFDVADRPATVSTGADVPALLSGGQSVVTFDYSARGVLRQVGGSYGVLATTTAADAFGAPTALTLGDRSATQATYSRDDRRRPSEFLLTRGDPTSWALASGGYTPPPSSPPSTLQRQLEHIVAGYDGAGNLNHLYDRRDAAEWPAGAKPVDRSMTYDGAHRLTAVTYSYANNVVDSQVSPFAAEEASGDARPAPRSVLGTRVAGQTYSYDWRGNLTGSGDDLNARFDRSLGTVVYDPVAQNRMISAANGAIRADYDDAGDLVNLIVERQGSCSAPTGKCVQRYVYDWDEVGQLARARRWDYTTLPGADPPYPAVPAEAPAVDLSFEYSQGIRVRKTSSDGISSLHDVYVFDSLRLEDAEFDATSGDYLRGDQGGHVAETAYLGGVARVAYVDDDVPSLSSGHLRVLLEVGDHLGSTSLLLDKETGELVEKMSYQAYGGTDSDYRPSRWASFRERRRLTGTDDDYEVGLSYFGGRYYSANLSRWISPDPLTIHGLGADLNPYAYVGGSPMQTIDIGGFGPPGCDNLSPGCTTGIDVPGFLGGLIDLLGNLGSTAGTVARDGAARRLDAARTARSAVSWAIHNPRQVNWGAVQHWTAVNARDFLGAYSKAFVRDALGMIVQPREGEGSARPLCASAICAPAVPMSLLNAPHRVLVEINRYLAPPTAASGSFGARVGDHVGSVALQVSMAVIPLAPEIGAAEVGAANGGKDIALGLSSTMDHSEGLLARFAANVGAVTHEGWVAEGLAEQGSFESRFLQAADNAEGIKFNLSGIKGIEGGVPNVPISRLNPTSGETTMAELAHILRTPSLLEKTTFYLDGEALDQAPTLLP